MKTEECRCNNPNSGLVSVTSVATAGQWTRDNTRVRVALGPEEGPVSVQDTVMKVIVALAGISKE